ncbi:hypothetical protein B0O80DRAFT_207845 [Mortierella sp. GBAus27b]|nr:hypothetical protein B0O80DRAFT_207845 [Mortierella sp. GBAus27b]
MYLPSFSFFHILPPCSTAQLPSIAQSRHLTYWQIVGPSETHVCLACFFIYKPKELANMTSVQPRGDRTESCCASEI